MYIRNVYLSWKCLKCSCSQFYLQSIMHPENCIYTLPLFFLYLRISGEQLSTWRAHSSSLTLSDP